METHKHRKWPDTFIFSLGSATAIFPNDIESHFNMGFWCTRCAAPDNRESWKRINGCGDSTCIKSLFSQFLYRLYWTIFCLLWRFASTLMISFLLRSVKIALAVLAPVYCTPWTTSALPNWTNLSCKVFFLPILGHFMQKWELLDHISVDFLLSCMVIFGMPRLTLPSFECFLALAACEAKECAPLLVTRLARRVFFLGGCLLLFSLTILQHMIGIIA